MYKILSSHTLRYHLKSGESGLRFVTFSKVALKWRAIFYERTDHNWELNRRRYRPPCCYCSKYVWTGVAQRGRGSLVINELHRISQDFSRLSAISRATRKDQLTTIYSLLYLASLDALSCNVILRESDDFDIGIGQAIGRSKNGCIVIFSC